MTIRYFTAEVRSAWKLLVVAPQPAAEQALYLTEALAPAAFRKNGQARFSCDVVPYDQLRQHVARALRGGVSARSASVGRPGLAAIGNLRGFGRRRLALILGEHAQP